MKLKFKMKLMYLQIKLKYNQNFILSYTVDNAKDEDILFFF